MSDRLVTGTGNGGNGDAKAPARDLLIALNTRLDLPREAVVRLALEWKRWARAEASTVASTGAPEATTPESTAPESTAGTIGVRPRYLAEARRMLSAIRRLAADERRDAAAAGARIVTLGEPDYPPSLLELELPPPVLYVRGALPSGPAIAIVGSRQADAYALDAARSFARELAERGMTVISGLARGVDAAAHRGALEAPGGNTVAVQACGIERVYPRRHWKLGEEIARRGALLTEFPLGTDPIPRNFPVRNRLIAALSVGTLVVQAARRSGTLITARLALELGREVWAIPGSIYRQRAVGANELLRDGAAIAIEPRDILESLPLAVRDRLRESSAVAAGGSAATPDGLAGEVLTVLERQTCLAPDQISIETSAPVGEVLAALAELELAGLARRCPGPVYRVAQTATGVGSQDEF